MAGVLAGLLNIDDSTRVKVTSVNMGILLGALGEVADFHNRQLDLMTRLFVARDETLPQIKYFPRFRDTMVAEAEGAQKIITKVGGEYTVAFPLYGYTNTKAYSDIDLAYMTIEDLDRQTQAVLDANAHQVKIDLLTALFRGADLTFDDRIAGNIAVKPFASGALDSVSYPPPIGSSTPATHSHLKGYNYTVASIDGTTNDPVSTIIDDLEEHFGYDNNGANIVIFAGTTLANKIDAVYGATSPARFIAVTDRYIQTGISSDTVRDVLGNVPGKVRGRLTDGAWLVEWREIPANYALAIHLDTEAPVYRRLDIPDARDLIPVGLHLLTNDLAKYPLLDATWRNRYGFGIANRLGGLVVLFNNATYSAPTFS